MRNLNVLHPEIGRANNKKKSVSKTVINRNAGSPFLYIILHSKS